MRMFKTGCVLVISTALAAGVAMPNNLGITNISISGNNNTTALVKFDISWDNSWRYAAGGGPLYLHDAAWVFFKVKAEGESEWKHVTLVGSGINPVGFDAGTGTPVEMVVPVDGAGMFVRRSADGAGPVAVEQMTAVWNFAANGFTRNDKVRLQGLCVEMCYVAEGSFKVGDGLADMGQFYDGGTGANPQPFAIVNAGAIECGEETGKLWGASQTGNTSMGGVGTIPAAFPNGYNAFYCMKYVVTQGQYVDFLNMLTRLQQTTRCTPTTLGNYMSDTAGGSVSIQYRNTVQLVEDSGDPQPRVYDTVTPDRAINWLSWADLAAFLAWSGLRPVTELEYEKACRGPLEPVAGEFAWGTPHYVAISDLQGMDGSGQEYYATGNLASGSLPSGPVRAGVFARPGSAGFTHFKAPCKSAVL